MTAKILVVDDEESIRFGLARLLEQAGYGCLTACSATEGFEVFTEYNPVVVLLDLRLPDMEGLEFMQKLKEADPYVAIIIMTAYGTIETAVSALKSGAENFLTKPIDPDGLLVLLKKTMEISDIKRRGDYMRIREDAKAADYYVGTSDKLRRVHDMVRALAQSDTTVLILGETGTGKGLYARLIHNTSNRAIKNYVEINCAGISRELLESELFGYDKGAFTGAVSNKPGLFELAHGGTLFLDEIGEMELTVQSKLLKVIEDMRFRRLGGIQEKAVDVRVIAASNRDLVKEVKAKKFRDDLFYRLNVMPIHVPPLRELQEDILPMSEHFLRSIAQKLGKPISGFSSSAQKAILNYGWPGNIRELTNLIERAVLLSTGDVINTADLGLAGSLRQQPSRQNGEAQALDSLEALEGRHIRRVLEACGNNLSQAAEILGITRTTLYSKIRKYRIPV